DSYEKKLTRVLKIHTEDNVADLLTKDFDVSRFIYDGMWRNLDGSKKKFLMYLIFLQIFLKNQIPDLVEPLNDVYVPPTLTKKGEGLGSGPRCQETIGGAMAQIRPKGTPIQSSDPPVLTGGHTPGSDEGSLTLKELKDLCTTLSQKVLDLEKVKTTQAKEIASLKKRVTKLEQRQSLRISGFHPFRADADTEVIVKDKGSGEKGGNTAKTVSTARPDISADGPEVSTVELKTPPTTTTFFDDEDVTIADTLIKMKSQKAKEKGVAFKDDDDSTRTIRYIKTLQPLPTIDPKDKERERQEEASKAALAELYDEVQPQIDADYELAARFTDGEQEKYTVKERFTHAQLKSMSFEEIQKLHTKEHKWVDAFVPIGSGEDEKRVRSRKKRIAGSSSKQKSPKKQKVNDQESVDSDKELKKCLKVVLDDDKAINYENLYVKCPIVDSESQVLGTIEASDVHVYKLTRLDGSYRHFLTFSRMIKVLDRQNVFDLHKIVMERFLANDPEVSINMFVEKRYPLTKEILEKILSWILEAETKSTLALDIIKIIQLQIEEK
nr:hypothetical protein [Tanacetum cinerariifolium]